MVGAETARCAAVELNAAIAALNCYWPADRSARLCSCRYVAELMRIKGELVLRQNQPEAAASARALFSSSLDWSRKQNALSWELRTAISFARLLEQQGRGNEARALLEPIYVRFTEGFVTKDLVEARSLLTSLGVTFAA